MLFQSLVGHYYSERFFFNIIGCVVDYTTSLINVYLKVYSWIHIQVLVFHETTILAITSVIVFSPFPVPNRMYIIYFT